MKKKLGTGSLSLLLGFLALVWSCSIQEFCIGDYLLTKLNLPTWSEGTVGTHYTVFWGLPLYLIGYILGCRYNTHLFARSGKCLCGILGGYFLVMGTTFMIWR